MKINDKHLLAYGSSPESIDKEGYLSKRGELNKGFQRRWFVLKGNLLFYTEKRGEKPVGVIVLEDCSVEVSDDAGNYSFTISFFGDRTRVYVLSAETEDEMISWMKRISTAPYGYAAMVVKELEKRLERLKKNEQELISKQTEVSSNTDQVETVANLIDFEPDDDVQKYNFDLALDKTDNLRIEKDIKDLSLDQRKLGMSTKSKGSANRNTIAVPGNPKSFNNLLTVAGAAGKLKNNILPIVRRSKSSENINKLVSTNKSPATSPVPPRRKFHQSMMRKKTHAVKIEHPRETTTSSILNTNQTQALQSKETLSRAPLKSTFYVIHNRYAATIWTAIKEAENESGEDLLKFD